MAEKAELDILEIDLPEKEEPQGEDAPPEDESGSGGEKKHPFRVAALVLLVLVVCAAALAWLYFGDGSVGSGAKNPSCRNVGRKLRVTGKICRQHQGRQGELSGTGLRRHLGIEFGRGHGAGEDTGPQEGRLQNDPQQRLHCAPRSAEGPATTAEGHRKGSERRSGGGSGEAGIFYEVYFTLKDVDDEVLSGRPTPGGGHGKDRNRRFLLSFGFS